MAEDFSNCKEFHYAYTLLADTNESTDWVAHMFFKDPKNGTYHRVMPKPVQPLLGGSQGAQGGLTIYYPQFDLSRDNLKQQPVKAFPPVSRPFVTHQVQIYSWDGSV